MSGDFIDGILAVGIPLIILDDEEDNSENDYYVCQECGEPIYLCDYPEGTSDREFINNRGCPVCGTEDAIEIY